MSKGGERRSTDNPNLSLVCRHSGTALAKKVMAAKAALQATKARTLIFWMI
jgi:hypothetical protein